MSNFEFSFGSKWILRAVFKTTVYAACTAWYGTAWYGTAWYGTAWFLLHKTAHVTFLFLIILLHEVVNILLDDTKKQTNKRCGLINLYNAIDKKVIGHDTSRSPHPLNSSPPPTLPPTPYPPLSTYYPHPVYPYPPDSQFIETPPPLLPLPTPLLYR